VTPSSRWASRRRRKGGFNARYIFYDPAQVTGLEMLNSANQPLFYDWRPSDS
jgi:hypothetical protein